MAGGHKGVTHNSSAKIVEFLLVLRHIIRLLYVLVDINMLLAELLLCSTIVAD